MTIKPQWIDTSVSFDYDRIRWWIKKRLALISHNFRVLSESVLAVAATKQAAFVILWARSHHVHVQPLKVLDARYEDPNTWGWPLASVCEGLVSEAWPYRVLGLSCTDDTSQPFRQSHRAKGTESSCISPSGNRCVMLPHKKTIFVGQRPTQALWDDVHWGGGAFHHRVTWPHRCVPLTQRWTRFKNWDRGGGVSKSSLKDTRFRAWQHRPEYES